MRRVEINPPFGLDFKYQARSLETPYQPAPGRNKLWEKASGGERDLTDTVSRLALLDEDGIKSFFRNGLIPTTWLTFSVDDYTYRLSRIQLGFELWNSYDWDLQRGYVLEKHPKIASDEIPSDSTPIEVAAIKVSRSDPHIYHYKSGLMSTDSKEAWEGFKRMLRVMTRRQEDPWVAIT